jgi:hypothetical protein
MKNYRFFLGAAGMANLADGIATIVWVWVATLITRDAGLIALVPVALRLPWALFAIPAGLVADRVDRRRLTARSSAVRERKFESIRRRGVTSRGGPGWDGRAGRIGLAGCWPGAGACDQRSVGAGRTSADRDPTP